MKKTLSLILTLPVALAALFCLPVSAEASPAVVDFFGDVQCSVTDSNVTGWGLGFCFDVTASGVAKSSTDLFINTNATVSYGGVDYPLVQMGAVVTNRPEVGEDLAQLTREAAEEDTKRIKDIRASKLYRADATDCSYVIRIIDIPFEAEDKNLYARPYVILRDGDVERTLYGDIHFTTYADQMARFTLKLPAYGTDPDGKGRVFVGDTAVIQNTLYVEIQEELDEWMTEDDAWIQLTCYDAEGMPLTATDSGSEASDPYKLYIGEMSSTKQTVTLSIEMPEGTAEVRITDKWLKYWTEWEPID